MLQARLIRSLIPGARRGGVDATHPFLLGSLVLCALAGRHNWATIWGAQIYLAARLLYLPLYAFGVPVLRTLVWLIGTRSIILLLVALFYPAI